MAFSGMRGTGPATRVLETICFHRSILTASMFRAVVYILQEPSVAHCRDIMSYECPTRGHEFLDEAHGLPGAWHENVLAREIKHTGVRDPVSLEERED